MTHQQLSSELLKHNFMRVERDDRLLDILPAENREKGVELWQRWGLKTYDLIRIRLPYDPAKLKAFSFPREYIDSLLVSNTPQELSDEPRVHGLEDVMSVIKQL